MAAYFDNNATTRPDPRVVEAMLPLWREQWGNASSGHSFGRPVRALVGEARRRVADALGVDAGEVVFTGSGTEADNLAIRGVVLASKAPRHVITTAVEHPAVLETCRDLQRQGLCTLDELRVGPTGLPDLGELKALLKPGETCLVSAMWANNETGVVLPIAQIGELAHAAGARLHVDGVQAIGKLAFDLDRLAIDLLSISAHKFHGPKGVGALIVRKGVKLQPMTTGGGQERDRRSGTENPAGIVGLAAALEIAVHEQPRAAERMRALRDRLERELTARVPQLAISGAGAPRLPNTCHFTLPDIEAESLLLLLDEAGIACSAGSACSTGAHEPSHVLLAMGVARARAAGAIRLSLSRETTESELDSLLEILPRSAARLRRIGV
jgi:cysteine desulfurase